MTHTYQRSHRLEKLAFEVAETPPLASTRRSLLCLFLEL